MDSELQTARRAVALDPGDVSAQARLQAALCRTGDGRSLLTIEECECLARAVEGFSQWLGAHLDPVYKETCLIRDRARQAREARAEVFWHREWLGRRGPWGPKVLDQMLTVVEGRAIERRLFVPDLIGLAKECLADPTAELKRPQPGATPKKPWRRLRGGELVRGSYGYPADYTLALAKRVKGGVLLTVARARSFASALWIVQPWTIIPKGSLK